MKSVKVLLALLVSVFVFSLQAPAFAQSLPLNAYDADVAISWFDLQLDLTKTTPGFTPPVASRAFAYSGVTLYEAVVPAMSGYQSLAGHLNELPVMPPPVANLDYDWRAVANSALYEITHHLYFNTPEENHARIEALYHQWQDQFVQESGQDVIDRSVMHGRTIANAILVWSLSDGGYQGQLSNFPESYTPPEGPGLWVSTPRPNGDPLPAMQPYWGDNRTFAVDMAEECVLAPPPAYSEDVDSPFYAEAYEVYETVQHLTDEQNAIALFWADDPGATATPPGHSVSILNQVLEQEQATLDVAAEAYAKLGVAQADAFILGWYYKFEYNLIRPISYIQSVIDADWNTPVITDPVVTPPFPEYPSGHSVQSGAAAQVLTAMFGDSYRFTDHTHDDRGLAPRTFDSFYAFADEAAVSRLYGGIHFRAAIELGVENGKCIGAVANALPLRAGNVVAQQTN